MKGNARTCRRPREAQQLRALALSLLFAGGSDKVIGQNPAISGATEGEIARSNLVYAARLPDAPAKSLVLQHCNVCHDLGWIEKSGGTVQGWTSRLQRMRRAGATLPPDKFAEVAAYLATAFPERPITSENRSAR